MNGAFLPACWWCFAPRSGYVYFFRAFWFSTSGKTTVTVLSLRCYRYYCHIINRTRNLSQSLLGIVSLLDEFGHGLPFPRWNPPSSIVPQSERLSINILEDDRWCGELWRARNKVAARKTEDGFGLPLWLRVIEERKRKINVSETDGTCIFWIFERRRGWSYIL